MALCNWTGVSLVGSIAMASSCVVRRVVRHYAKRKGTAAAAKIAAANYLIPRHELFGTAPVRVGAAGAAFPKCDGTGAIDGPVPDAVEGPAGDTKPLLANAQEVVPVFATQ